jgi:hypothetical protein
MEKLPFTQEELLETYKKEINEMLDVCDWKSTIDNWDICSTAASIAEANGVSINPIKLLDLYEQKVSSLNLTDEQWRTEYGSWETGVPKIIAIIYEIIEKNHE